MTSIESEIEFKGNGWLKEYGLDFKMEQASLNSEIDNALENYFSKTGGNGANRPDVKLLIENNGEKYPVIIEYKGYKNKLLRLDSNGQVANKIFKNGQISNEPNLANIKSYALNGAVHYANALLHYTNYEDIIAIGMSGYKNVSGELEHEIAVYLVSKSNFGLGQKIGEFSDFSFLKKRKC